MENLKNLWDWFTALGWSNQAVIVILFIALIFGAYKAITIIKIKAKGTTTTSTSIGWLLAVGAGYGIYLIVINNLPTTEEKIFSELSKNLAEVELQLEKDKLSALNAKVKGGEILTEEEKRLAMNATKKIEKIRKNYSEGKLVVPAPIVEKPTTKMAWVLRLDGSFNRQSSDAVEIDEKSIFRITETEIMFSYYKRGEKHEVWLTREKSGKFYHGVLSLSDKTKQDLYLLENGEAFSGYIQQINGNGKSKKALLRKEEVMIK